MMRSRNLRCLFVSSLRTRTEKANPADERKTEREPVCRRLCIKGLVNKFTGGGGGRSEHLGNQWL